MTKFIYQAKNEAGQIVSGTVEAENEKAATQALWENKLRVVSLRLKPTAPGLMNLFNKVKVADKSVFTRQLSTMISAGIHLPTALSVCASQAKSKRLSQVLRTVVQDVEEGHSLSLALSRHPDIFDNVFVAVVKAGEVTGKLDQALLSLADRLEKDTSFRGKVRSALIYPAFIFIVLIGVGILMMVKVIPQIKDILTGSKVELPLVTRFLLAASDFMVANWVWVLVGVLGLGIGFGVFLRTKTGVKWWNIISIKVPVLGEVNKNVIMARFTQTFHLLAKTGIPILDALNALADVMDNEIYRQSLYRIASDVEKGIPLSVPLSKDKNFPSIIGQMIGVGEQSGALADVLEKVGTFYENAVDEQTKTLSALIEPIVIVILGVGVAVLVFAVLMPIYQLAQVQ